MSKDREDLTARIKQLEDTVREQQEKIAAGEEGAMNRVCAALDMSPSVIKSREGGPKAAERMIECFIPMDVRINQKVYRGKCKVPESVFQVLSQAIGDHRMRLLRELTGDKTILEQVGNVWTSKVIETVGMNGERIA